MNFSSPPSWLRHCLNFAPGAAALLFTAAVIGFGAALDGYSQAAHPVALLGARGLAHGMAFDVLGFILPGVLAAWFAQALRSALPRDASWSLRLGTQLLLLAALAFAAMGVWPLQLDPGAVLNTDASRAHGIAWLLWLVAFVLALAAFAIGAWPRRAKFALATAAVLAGVLLFALLLPVQALAPGVAQRLAFALWWLWLAGAGWSAAHAALR